MQIVAVGTHAVHEYNRLLEPEFFRFEVIKRQKKAVGAFCRMQLVALERQGIAPADKAGSADQRNNYEYKPQHKLNEKPHAKILSAEYSCTSTENQYPAAQVRTLSVFRQSAAHLFRSEKPPAIHQPAFRPTYLTTEQQRSAV